MSDWAGQAAGSSNVRNAPLATVGPKKPACRDGPIGDIGASAREEEFDYTENRNFLRRRCLSVGESVRTDESG
jgi:hypothetical protein